MAKISPFYEAAIRSELILDKEKLLINLKIIFPNLNINKIRKKMNNEKYFYIKKRLKNNEKHQLWLLGDKAIEINEKLGRVYPHRNLFSHIIGQIDNENIGISGIEKSFDNYLKNSNKPLSLSVDANLQYLIKQELLKAQKIFNPIGSASLLMDVNNGEILSLISLPDFDLNSRQQIDNPIYLNRITKAVYELGSVFKTFTFAAGINEGVIEPETEFIDLEKKLKCGKNTIGEYDDKIPSNLTAEQILIRSGNIGSVRIGQKLGIEKFKFFLEKIGVLNKIEFDIEEIGEPIPFKWGKCKLATASFGHGITTTALQLAKGYSIITNGGFNIKPTLIKKNLNKNGIKNRILTEGISEKINPILRKIVSTKNGTAGFANIDGYDVGGKTGTAQKTSSGGYSKAKVNTFAAVFPSIKPKYVLIVLLDEPKPNKEYVYYFKDGSGWKYKGNWRNTAGWTSVEVAGKIIEKIGPILATNNLEGKLNF